ncbi:MAG: cell division protein FtsA [Candidatus Latescibacteria bacterium]|nr:cell division protein FtsA [Candidatus Latescibacterota bacterium]
MAATNLIAGLDIGTTKIVAIIAEPDEGGSLRILGVGKSPSLGLRRGVVVNLEKTIRSIQDALDTAERLAGVEIGSIYAGIAGDHIRSINSRGVIAVSRRGNEITQPDVDRVIEAAKAIALPMDREIIHVIPQEFIVDDQSGIRDPVGMAGVRLEGEIHIITGAVTSAQNIYKSVQRAGVEVHDRVLQPLATSYAVLSEDEKELGVAVLDLGGGTADLAVFYDGSIRHTAVIGLGGENVTNDVAIGLRTPRDEAERIKIEHGIALQSMVEKDEIIEVPGVGGRPHREVSRDVLAAIIEPRMEEIFALALREIQRSEYVDLLTTGLVLTGGGAMLEGACELAEQVFDLPVKIGIPGGIAGLSEEVATPIYATAVGLLRYAVQEGLGRGRRFLSTGGGLFDSILARMRRWMDEFF